TGCLRLPSEGRRLVGALAASGISPLPRAFCALGVLWPLAAANQLASSHVPKEALPSVDSAASILPSSVKATDVNGTGARSERTCFPASASYKATLPPLRMENSELLLKTTKHWVTRLRWISRTG